MTDLTGLSDKMHEKSLEKLLVLTVIGSHSQDDVHQMAIDEVTSDGKSKATFKS